MDDSNPRYLRPQAYSDVPAERDLLQRFAEKGYVIVDLARPDFEELAARLIQNIAPYYGDRDRVADGYFRSEAVKSIALDKQILELLRALYGREPFAFQTLNFAKGTEQRTHADTIHFDSDPADFMCGVWVAFEDIDLNNGPLHYYPGTHHLPRLTFADCGYPQLSEDSRFDLYRTAYDR